MTQQQLIKSQIAHDPNTFGTTLIALLLDGFTTEALDWDAYTICTAFEDRYGKNVPDKNLDKLLAMCTVYTTDTFFVSLNSFINISNALTNGVDFTTFDPVTVDEASWAVTEVLLNTPPEKKITMDKLFHPDIRAYLGTVITSEGMLTPPAPLTMAIMPTDTREELKWFEYDPSLYPAIVSVSNAKIIAVEETVKNNLLELFEQLKKTFGKDLPESYTTKILQLVATKVGS